MANTKNFSDLDDYMKIEIFNKLNGKDIKNCLQVCKNWNNLIGQSPTIMNELTFEMGFLKGEEKFQEQKESYSKCKLQFQRMQLDSEEMVDENALKRIECIQTIAKNIKILEINHVHFSNEGMLFKFLSSFESLEKLLIVNVDYSKPSDENKQVIEAPTPKLNLKKLVLITVSKSVIQSLAKANVQSSWIMNSFTPIVYNGDKDYTHVIDLLNCQDNLVTLGLNTFNLEQQRAVYQQLNAKLKPLEGLKCLTVDFTANADADPEKLNAKKHFDHFCRVLTNLKSLDELEICSWSVRVPQKVFTTIHKSLKLKKLRLNVRNLPETFEMKDSTVFVSNPHLKSFRYISLESELPGGFTETFFKMFADIEDLMFFGNMYENIQHASVNLKQLQNLKVGVVGLNFSDCEIPSLKSFKTIRTDSIPGVQKFLDANPSIENLKLHFPKTIFNTSSVPMLTRKLVNLENLTFSGYSNLNKNYEMCHGLSLNCPKLRVVKMHTMYPAGSSKSKEEDLVVPPIKLHSKVKLMATKADYICPEESMWDKDDDFNFTIYFVTAEDDADVFYDENYDFGTSDESDDDEANFDADRISNRFFRTQFSQLPYDSDDSVDGFPNNGSNYFRNFDDWINRQGDWDYEDWQDFKEMFMDSD